MAGRDLHRTEPMTSKSMSVRLPEQLAKAIAARVEATGKDKTTVVVEALTQAFELPTTQALVQQLKQLKDQVASLSEQLAEVRQNTYLDSNPSRLITAIEQVVVSIATKGDTSSRELTQGTSLPSRKESSTVAETADNHLESQPAQESQQLRVQLEHQARTLDQILSAVPDLVSVFERTGRITYINPAGAQAFGFDRHYLLGKTFTELGLRAEVSESFTVQCQAVFATGRAISGEFSLPALQNGPRDYEYILSPIQGASSRPDAVVCTARDMTERKLAETALRESEAKYRNLFESANDSILIIDAETNRFLNVNQNAARRLGYTRAEMLVLCADNIDAPWAASRKQAIIRQLEANGHVIYEYGHRRKDGREMPVEISSRVIEYGNRLAFQCFVRDITERKQAEERLRLLESAVANAHDAILITQAEPIDEPGPRIVYVNAGFTRMTGYTSEEVIGKTPRILQGPKTDRAHLDKIRTALSQWSPLSLELINYRKDGSEFWVELNLVPFADESGWYTHWMAIQRDITERKQAEMTKNFRF